MPGSSVQMEKIIPQIPFMAHYPGISQDMRKSGKVPASAFREWRVSSKGVNAAMERKIMITS